MGKPSITERSRRSLRKVETVVSTEQGRASCTDHTELFDRVEDRRADYGDRIAAADVCNRCPLSGGCAFRVIPSGQRKRRKRSTQSGGSTDRQ